MTTESGSRYSATLGAKPPTWNHVHSTWEKAWPAGGRAMKVIDMAIASGGSHPGKRGPDIRDRSGTEAPPTERQHEEAGQRKSGDDP